MEVTKLKVDLPKFKVFEDSISCAHLIEGKAIAVHQYLEKKLVITGAVSDRSKKGLSSWRVLFGCYCCPLSVYKGSLTPLPYGEHWDEVTDNKRDRSYIGMLFKKGSVEYVFTGPKVEVTPTAQGQQTSLF